MGGHEAVRYLWFDFLSDSHAIVFMIDRADGERLEEAHWELSELLSDVSSLELDILGTQGENKLGRNGKLFPFDCTQVAV